MIIPPPCSTLFPYTTLFRSDHEADEEAVSETIESTRAPEPVGAFPHAKRVGELLFLSGIGPRVRGSKEIPGVTRDSAGNRSEEHTSELQSHHDLVCRLLLEK